MVPESALHLGVDHTPVSMGYKQSKNGFYCLESDPAVGLTSLYGVHEKDHSLF